MQVQIPVAWRIPRLKGDINFDIIFVTHEYKRIQCPSCNNINKNGCLLMKYPKNTRERV